MKISMQALSIDIFTYTLGNLSAILEKGVAHATAKKFDSNVLVASRLAPDMLPFKNQIQIACDTVKFCVARLAGVESPKFEDNETTLSELRERINATIAYAKSVPAAQIDGSEDKDITVPRRDGPIIMKGEVYLKHFALPNMFFHLTTAYALLRHNGVELGKMDYLGAPKS